MKSMTGYGKGAVQKNGYEITVELKSVNHRYFDINIKSPKILSFADDLIRKEIQKKISRGHIDAYINCFDRRENKTLLSLNKDVVEGLLAINYNLKSLYNLDSDLTTSKLMNFPEVYTENPCDSDVEELSETLKECLIKATDNLDQMRICEGKALHLKLSEFLSEIENLVLKIKNRAPKVGEVYRQKLTERIKNALNDVEVDENKLINEVAFFIDRSNIDEELTRLSSHIEQLKNMFEESLPVGKKIDFLVQELNREANTIGSKSNDLEVTNLVVLLKTEIEKLREQIQNIE